MIKNVIFDIGNVILEYNPKRYLREKIMDLDLEKILFKEIFQSKEWERLDRGTITEEEAINEIIKRNPTIEQDIRKAFENWYELLLPIKETMEVIKILKREGYNIYYLSNFHKNSFEVIKQKYNFLEEFNGGIVSFNENLLKPEFEIYKKLLEKYNLKGEECVFIDDMEININAAKKININTILYKDYDNLIKGFKNYGIKINEK